MLFPSAPWNQPKYLAWVILVFAAGNVIFLGGKRRAFGSFVAVLRKDFKNMTLTELNWIGDSYAALGYMTTGISISIILYFHRRYSLFQFIGSLFVLASCLSSSVVPNPHWLFLTHTLLHGIGSSLILSVIGLVVNEHFPNKHPYHLLATTLISGGSVASIVFVAIFAALIEGLGWRLAFIVLGILYFVINASASLVFTKIDELDKVEDSKKMTCDCKGNIKRYHVPLLVLWMIDRIMTSVVTYGLLLNLTDYVHRFEPSLLKSTILTTLFASGEASTYLIGAIITAATKDFFKNRLKYILLVTSITMSASLFILEFTASSQVLRRLLCFVAGFSLGPSITFLFPAGEEMTLLPGHIAYPFSLGSMGLGMMISPLLTAKIAEAFKYNGFFLVQGALIAIKVACLIAIIVLLLFYARWNTEYGGYDNLNDSEQEVEEEVLMPKEEENDEKLSESSQLLK